MNKVPRGLAALCLMAGAIAAQDSSKTQTAKGPFPYTRKSIGQGQQSYLRNCADCHDRDGRSLSGRDFTSIPPADLTDPDSWRHGVSVEAIFSSIREGTKEEMPPFKSRLRDDQIWHIVNFLRSLWPEDRRPKLEDEH